MMNYRLLDYIDEISPRPILFVVGDRVHSRLLGKHRDTLLDTMHREQKRIDCLDYLLYQMKKAQ